MCYGIEVLVVPQYTGQFITFLWVPRISFVGRRRIDLRNLRDKVGSLDMSILCDRTSATGNRYLVGLIRHVGLRF
jgi:hypothetical protein